MMTDIVRRAEQLGETFTSYHITLCVDDIIRMSCQEFLKICLLSCRMNRWVILQYNSTSGIVIIAYRTRVHIDVGILDEVLLLIVRQLMPVPPCDDIVQMEGHTLIIHRYTIR